MATGQAAFLAITALSLLTAGCVAQGKEQDVRTVMVHLFEWGWNDIAEECETHLGPLGFAAVQVSPPQEHVTGSQWWTRYQPVSYRIESRSGTRSQFADMVARCKKVGVGIIVDAVINHMTGVGSGRGIAGSSYSEYNYPAVPYGPDDFHYCSNPNSDILGSDYTTSATNVRECELVNLADLKTDSDRVRRVIATEYLNELMKLGVSGFRIDASKHMYPADIGAVMKMTTGSPYIFQEVIGSPGEAISPEEYLTTGDVTEFTYGRKLAETFQSGKLKYLETFGPTWGLMPSDKAVVFTNNHDNQRGHGGGSDVLTWRDGEVHTLASIFMLAFPYGYPKLMSSFTFEDTDQGPPQQPAFGCGSRWVCEHRIPAIGRMVEFRNIAASNFTISHWWDNGNNAIGFGRGDRAFIVLNREDTDVEVSIQSGLAAGTYCDIISGEVIDNSCTGSQAVVDQDGSISATIDRMSAVAVHIRSRLQAAKPTEAAGTTIPSIVPIPITGTNPAVTPAPTDGPDRSTPYQSSFESLSIRGDFNKWDTTAMSLVRDYTWSVLVEDLSGSFKVDVFGDWEQNYGGGREAGQLYEKGQNIRGPGGLAVVIVDDRARNYKILPQQ